MKIQAALKRLNKKKKEEAPTDTAYLLCLATLACNLCEGFNLRRI